MDTDLTDAPDSETPAIATRRGLLGAGLAGAALSLLPIATRRAGAQSDTTTPGTTTTTTTPPKRPTDADLRPLAFAGSMELAAVQLYEAAVAAGGLDEPSRQVLVTITEAHRAFGNHLTSFLGRSATHEAQSGLLAKYRGRFSATSTRFAAAIEVESAFVATYTKMLETLKGTDGAALVAAILIAEARHGTVLADVSGARDLAALLDDKPAAAIQVEG